MIDRAKIASGEIPLDECYLISDFETVVAFFWGAPEGSQLIPVYPGTLCEWNRASSRRFNKTWKRGQHCLRTFTHRPLGFSRVNHAQGHDL
jgi:hypothetical protein